MPLKKLTLKAGVNQENTRYTNENGWYISDKMRFRQGTPQKIGGWQRISDNTFLGICRSLWNWITLVGINLVGVGTNLKFYLEKGGVYNDITPIRATVTLGADPFAGNGTTTVTVTDTAHGALNGDFVTFSGATGTYASILNAEYQITIIDDNSYTITTASVLAAGSYGGSAVVAAYQISVGAEYAVPVTGWGGGGWSSGPWGTGGASLITFRIWSQQNFGEDLIFGPRGGAIYYWDATGGISSRGVLVSSLGGTVTLTIATPCVITLTTLLPAGSAIVLATTGALPTGLTAGVTYYLSNVSGLTANLSATPGGAAIATTGSQSGVQSISVLGDVPVIQNFLLISDASRFVFAFGCNPIGSAVQDPMLVRWSAQESIVEWYPQSTNQAGDIRLSHGSEIVTAVQARQEIVVFTDSSLYSFQYQGSPVVWSSQLLGDNISIVGQNAAIIASGVVYWMGVDKFYKYDGRVQTLRCDLRQYIYGDINLNQAEQILAGTNEGFNEVWWFYCSADSNVLDRYVTFNYFENNGEGVWAYGNLGRTAWLDSGLRDYPLAATYSYNLVNHEQGNDDNQTGTTLPINAVISSAEFDIDDGDHFGFVWRMLPDITFRGSDAASPQVTMTLIPMQNSGSGYNDPISLGGNPDATVTRTSTSVIEQFTGQVYVRVRGRQMILQIESNQIGCAWQLGSPRIDIKQDGRRGNS